MRVVGNCEYGLLLYRDKLPKFNNNGKMVFNAMEWERDTKSPKIHPTQKPIPLLEKMIKLFTDEGEIVIDPVAGSGSSIVAAINTNRTGYGFEIKKDFYGQAKQFIEERRVEVEEIKKYGWAKSAAAKVHPIFDFAIPST
jgi:site-specific DNA-methyltransferase (adenine-specific)